MEEVREEKQAAVVEKERLLAAMDKRSGEVRVRAFVMRCVALRVARSVPRHGVCHATEARVACRYGAALAMRCLPCAVTSFNAVAHAAAAVSHAAAAVAHAAAAVAALRGGTTRRQAADMT